MICSIITYWSRDHDGKKDGLLQQHKGKNSIYFAGIISNTGSTQPQNELFLQEKINLSSTALKSSGLSK